MVSVTGIGAIVMVVEYLAKLSGFELPDGSIANAVNGLVSFIGLVMIVWGQLRRKDLRYGIFRK